MSLFGKKIGTDSFLHGTESVLENYLENFNFFNGMILKWI
jgi:hypothetical protein